MKKIMSFVLFIALIIGIVLPTFSVALSISAEEAYTGVIVNGGSEETAYSFVYGGESITNEQNTDEVHSGSYSTKIVTKLIVQLITTKYRLENRFILPSGQRLMKPQALRVLYSAEMCIRRVKTALLTSWIIIPRPTPQVAEIFKASGKN